MWQIDSTYINQGTPGVYTQETPKGKIVFNHSISMWYFYCAIDPFVYNTRPQQHVCPSIVDSLFTA